MSYRPLIDDPGHRARLEGHRYVVLRPSGEIAHVFEEAQVELKAMLSAYRVSFPAQPHVTLAGVIGAPDVQGVAALAARCAETTPPLRIEVEEFGFFPPPAQILMLRILKTSELVRALTTLRGLMSDGEVPELAAVPPADWVFHMSLAYCAGLDLTAWANLTRRIDELILNPAACIVTHLEIVAFDKGREYAVGSVKLRGD